MDAVHGTPEALQVGGVPVVGQEAGVLQPVPSTSNPPEASYKHILSPLEYAHKIKPRVKPNPARVPPPVSVAGHVHMLGVGVGVGVGVGDGDGVGVGVGVGLGVGVPAGQEEAVVSQPTPPLMNAPVRELYRHTLMSPDGSAYSHKMEPN